MDNPRIYGKGPCSLAVIHGGPGVPGYVQPLAMELGRLMGVLEPFQTKDTLLGQVMELRDILVKNAETPVTLLGHSWGAWLAFITATDFPELIRKLILIAPGPFLESWANDITRKRVERLSLAERKELYELQKDWPFVSNEEKKEIFRKTGLLISKADTYEPVDTEDHTLDYQPEIFRKVWAEASELRKSGALFDLADKIKCPVVLIHGDYDPHPWEGAKKPLEKKIRDFTFYLLEKCGHEPWNEKHARDRFFEILGEEIMDNQDRKYPGS